MKDGKPSAKERRTLEKAEQTLREYVAWMRAHPANYDATGAYVALDGAKAIETYLMIIGQR